MFKSDIVKKFQKTKINVVVIIDNNLHRITAIVKNKYDKRAVHDIYDDYLPLGIGREIKIDKTLICNGTCFTEIKSLPEEIKKKGFFERIINLIKI